MAETNTSDADKIVAQARAEYEAGLKFRYDREKAWHLNEDFYFNKVKKNLKGKFNAPVPIIPGFVDTWQSKMAKHVNLTFEINRKESEFRAVQKTNGLLQAQKDHEDYDWDMMDTDGKKMGAIYGRTIYKYYAASKPEYKSNLEITDPYDMVIDPLGGGVDEKHRFKHQDNIFRSREELKDGAQETKIYDPGQVSKLINATKEDVIVDNDNIYKSKQNRFLDLGLNGLIYNYAGQGLYKMIESGTTYKGKRYYLLWNYETGIWVRCQPLKEVFASNLWPWTSWATNRDTFNYWSKSPCDDMLPLAEVIRVLINQEIDNRNKKNYGMRGYDPELIPDPAQLEWRQDGLVAFKNGSAKPLGDMSKATFQFETPDLNGTIDLASYLDNMLKEKTGVNSESQGQTDTQKVGIAYLNVQQSTERTALTYESYTKCWQGIGAGTFGA
jgi:hypothetical protein